MEDLEEAEATFDAQKTSFVQMYRVVHEYERRVQRSLSCLGLTLREYQALGAIRRVGHVRQARLADRCLVSRQRIQVVVRALERRHLIETSSDPRRRDVRVMLTPEGHSVLSDADAALDRLQSGILARFGVAHQAALTTLLAQLQEALRLWDTKPELFDH